MRITATPVAERAPHRSPLKQHDRPAGGSRRGELTAGLAALAVVAQLALAPVMLLVAVLLVMTGRISRWRLAWLLLPAAGSACWLTVAGFPAAAHALATGAGRLTAAELAVAMHPQRLLHPAAAFAGSGFLLARALPLLALSATAEAGLVLWTGREPGPGWRPGLVAALRCRAAAAALAAGHTVTAAGCAIGLDYSRGRLAAVSWAQAERGVLLTGSDPAELGELGLAIACAALRRRKCVLVLDLAGQGSGVAAAVGGLASRLGVPVAEIGSVAPVSPTAPVSPAAPVSSAARISTAPAAAAAGRAIRSRSVMLVRPREHEARSGPAQPGAVQSGPAQSGPAQSGAVQSDAGQRAVSELLAALTSLRDFGLRADCLAWISGCEAAGLSRLHDLLALGPVTGTAVVLSATSPAFAADLAGVAGLAVAAGPVAASLARCLAAEYGSDLEAASLAAKPAVGDLLRAQQRGSATMIASGGIAGPASFRILGVRVTDVR